MLDNLKKFAVSWIVMWALSYIVVALVAPQVSDVSPIVYGLLGAGLLVMSILTVLQEWNTQNDMFGFLLGLAYFSVAVLMVYGGVTSWTGISIWNVPFEAKEVFQVSMAFADFIAAAFMLYLFGEVWSS
jgi:hypothetical protein